MHDNVGAQWRTLAEAISITGRSERTLRRWASADKIPAKRDDDGGLLVDVTDIEPKPSRTRAEVADIPGVADKPQAEAAEVTAWRTKAETAERDLAETRRQVADLTGERDYLRSALAAALSSPQRALPAPRKRPWWRFWEQAQPQDEG